MRWPSSPRSSHASTRTRRPQPPRCAVGLPLSHICSSHFQRHGDLPAPCSCGWQREGMPTINACRGNHELEVDSAVARGRSTDHGHQGSRTGLECEVMQQPAIDARACCTLLTIAQVLDVQHVSRAPQFVKPLLARAPFRDAEPVRCCLANRRVVSVTTLRPCAMA